MKYILGGAFITLGLIKLMELKESKPEIGVPLIIILGAIWIIEVLKEFYKGRK